jgi:hypothetical protein
MKHTKTNSKMEKPSFLFNNYFSLAVRSFWTRPHTC